jgi:hypothetical protein
MKFNYPISNNDIIEFCKSNGIHLDGVIMRDEFVGQNGIYIVNLDESKGSGTHWVGLIHFPKYCLYFDSYGVLPIKELIKYCKSPDIYYNSFIIQDEYSVLCGWFCIGFINWMQSVLSKPKQFIRQEFNKYTQMFYTNETINDSAIITYIRGITQ